MLSKAAAGSKLGFVAMLGLAVAFTTAACNTDQVQMPAQTATPPSVTQTAAPTPAVQQNSAQETPPPGLKPADYTAYSENASRVIDLIGRTAQLLASLGLDANRAGDGQINTKNLAEAAIGSFDLAQLTLDAEPVPEGLEELHKAILTSLRFYTEAAQKLLDIPETGEFDFFEFQRPFQTGGENFHEAGRLLAES